MFLKSLFALLQLTRPINVVIGMFSIFIAAFITGTIQPFMNVILACITGGFITAAGNTINDYFDLDIDRVNKPNRPLASGKISSQSALLMSLVEFILGISISFFINIIAFGITVSISILIFLYSYRLKRMLILGNLAVSFSGGMAFIFGGVAVNRIKQTLIPAILAFFYHFGREIIKDMQDMEGDQIASARTFPLVYGKKSALYLTGLNYLFLIFILVLPYVFKWYGIYYFFIILTGVIPVILFSLLSIWRNQTPKNLGLISNILKVDMLIGLLAIYLG